VGWALCGFDIDRNRFDCRLVAGSSAHQKYLTRNHSDFII
jgi:hypothetical protein